MQHAQEIAVAVDARKQRTVISNMPTEASCGICDWEETFETHDAAREAQLNHAHKPAFVKDISEEVNQK